MEFRKATTADADGILKIIRQAQAYLKSRGIDQWQNNYPNLETIQKDIREQIGYVLVKDSLLLGTAAVSFDGESTYDRIYEGEWKSIWPYGVVHRIAVHEEYKGQGLSSVMLERVEEICLEKGVHSIKVDTHEENLSMQKLLEKNGFAYCGVIYLEDHSKRIAFEKILA
ncbi:MAG: GNAT family N-acetyltransferase [Lachnospiraceae bacterium]|jgi:GNAT superfamily N-acetyltransferase|nr:GNAT family N-acetyltransferase [Lachnospiraceae bacterium]